VKIIHSPNFEERPPNGPIDMLILHYTGLPDANAAIQRLTDAQAKVSAHYLVDEDGAVLKLVEEDKCAWHAGIACWQGLSDINARSLGIELVNPGHEFGYRPFPEAQMQSLEALALDLVRRLSIPRRRILGHSDVAPLRKSDPGELFDWRRLAKAGLGLWPTEDYRLSAAPEAEAGNSGALVLDYQIALNMIGYCLEGNGVFDPLTEAVVVAFQRHFRPGKIDGRIDAETGSLIMHLAGLSASDNRRGSDGA
jgi:N-acetylmuramoyl-L-alanine amidase